MITLNEMMKNVTFKHHNTIKKQFQPLKTHFGISSFAHCKIFDTGKFYSYGTNPGWLEYYFGEKLYINQPHFRHPRNFRSGVCLPKYIQCDKYDQLTQIGREKYNLHSGLVLITRVSDGLELSGFDVNSSDPSHDLLLLNELPLIRLFLSKFENENKKIFTDLNDNQVDLELLLGKKFQVADVEIMPSLKLRNKFLKEIGCETSFSLSKRENEILKMVMDGYTATQIADSIFLSPRTVEHHIANIKNKLGCLTKSELIIKGKELEILGYLTP